MSTTTTMDNFTVQSADYIVNGGTNITDTVGGTVIMTLVPNVGFAIDAQNFSPIQPLPQGIIGITFAQNGANVEMTMLVDTTFVMPSNDLQIPICINGTSRQIGVILKGVINIDTGNNATPAPQMIPFEVEGPISATEEIITRTVTANSGKFFPTQPTISLVEGNPSDYSFNVTPSYTNDTQGTSRMTSAVCKAFYTYPEESVQDNEVLIFARAIEIPTVKTEITAYNIVQSNISPSGETRAIALTGVAGATFSVTVVGDSGTNPTFSNGTNTWAGTLASSSEGESITFPALAANDPDANYTVTITGNLASVFPPNPFVLSQEANINFTGSMTATNYTVTPGSMVLDLLPNQSSTDIGPSGQNYTYQAVVTGGYFGGGVININDFVKFGGNDNGFTINKPNISIAPDFASVTITVTGTIFETLANDFGFTLDLDASLVKKCIEYTVSVIIPPLSCDGYIIDNSASNNQAAKISYIDCLGGAQQLDIPAGATREICAEPDVIEILQGSPVITATSACTFDVSYVNCCGDNITLSKAVGTPDEQICVEYGTTPIYQTDYFTLTETTINCSCAYTGKLLGYSSVSEADACCDSTPQIYYLDASSLSAATAVYTDQAGTVAPAGYYAEV